MPNAMLQRLHLHVRRQFAFPFPSFHECTRFAIRNKPVDCCTLLRHWALFTRRFYEAIAQFRVADFSLQCPCQFAAPQRRIGDASADVVPSLIYSITASRNDRLEKVLGRMRYRRTIFDVLFREESFTSGIRAAVIKTSRATGPESIAVSNVRSPRSRNKPAIIRLRELQLRLARRGLVASCVHWNPFPTVGNLRRQGKRFQLRGTGQ